VNDDSDINHQWFTWTCLFQHLWHLISVIQRNSSSVSPQEFVSLDLGTVMAQLTAMIIRTSLHLVEL